LLRSKFCGRREEQWNRTDKVAQIPSHPFLYGPQLMAAALSGHSCWIKALIVMNGIGQPWPLWPLPMPSFANTYLTSIPIPLLIEAQMLNHVEPKKMKQHE
jgi:hypothetical protein